MKDITLCLLLICITVITVVGTIEVSKTVRASTEGQAQLEDKPQERSTATEGYSFDDLLDAIEWVESKGDPWAVGDDGKAVGAYQIWKIYVDDVNRVRINRRIGGYKYEDRYDRKLSREMVTIYLKHYGGTTEEMARKHNSGPQGHKKPETKKYWEKVKTRLSDPNN